MSLIGLYSHFYDGALTSVAFAAHARVSRELVSRMLIAAWSNQLGIESDN